MLTLSLPGASDRPGAIRDRLTWRNNSRTRTRTRSPAAGAQRASQGHLHAAGGTAGQQQVRQVRARDEQHDENGRGFDHPDAVRSILVKA